MKADARSSRIERARIGSNYALPEVGDLEPFIAQIVFDEFRHGPIEQHMLCVCIIAEPVFDLLARGRIANPQVPIPCWAQGVAQPVQYLVHRAPAFDIAQRKTTNLGFTFRVVVPELHAGTIEKWHEQAIHRWRPFEAALWQVQ